MFRSNAVTIFFAIVSGLLPGMQQLLAQESQVERWQKSIQKCSLPRGNHRAILNITHGNRVRQTQVHFTKSEQGLRLVVLDRTRQPAIILEKKTNATLWHRDFRSQTFINQNPMIGFITQHHFRNIRGPAAFKTCSLVGYAPPLPRRQAIFYAGNQNLSDAAATNKPFQQAIVLQCGQASNPDLPEWTAFFFRDAAAQCPERVFVYRERRKLILSIHYEWNRALKLKRVRLQEWESPESAIIFDLKILMEGIGGPLVPGG